jgi:hypothetical protein
MVFDVVASRQRNYLKRVRPLVQAFSARPAAESLATLAEHGPGLGLSLMPAEATTVQVVAVELLQAEAQRAVLWVLIGPVLVE